MSAPGSPSRVFRFPVYQIDFAAVQAGKRVASSKRRIRWRFGFPNRQALDAGRTGIDCRGEEHEVVVIWSIASGKRQILMDGKEIHYSSTRISILDHSWSAKGNHVLKVVCHAAPPMSVPPGFRQYDLLIDGQTFFSMPKVFELGIKSTGDRIPGIRSVDDYNGHYNTSAIEYGGGGGYPAAPSGTGYATRGHDDPTMRPPRTTEEEEAALQLAIRASLAESKQHLGESQQATPTTTDNQPPSVDLIAAAPPTSDLLDFNSGGGPPALMPDPMLSLAASGSSSLGTPSYGYDNYGAPPPQTQYQQPQAPPAPYGQYAAPGQQQQSYLALPSTQQHYGGGHGIAQPVPSTFASPGVNSSGGGYSSSGLSVDPYAGHTVDDPFAPKPPSHNEIANDILKSYMTPTGGSSQYQPGLPFSAQSNGYNNTDEDESNTGGLGGITLSMNGVAITEHSSKKPKSALEEAMAKLVNLDHIDEPAEEQLKLTMKQKEEEERRKNDKRSKPLPPVAKGVVGSAASLAQIQEVKPKLPPKELVMKPPPGLFAGDAAMAGAMVVHGSSFSTPPPLQQKGIGVVHMQGQYPSAHIAGSMGMYHGQAQQPMMMQQQPNPMMMHQQNPMMMQHQQQQMMMQTTYGQPPPQPMHYQQPPPAGYGSAGWR